MRRLLLLASLVLASLLEAACVFDGLGTGLPDRARRPADLAGVEPRALDGPEDASSSSSEERDRSTATDLPSDQALSDQSGDRGLPDQLPDQLLTPDLAADQRAVDQRPIPDLLLPCAVKYATVPSLKLCAEQPGGCRIFFRVKSGTPNLTCNAICALGQGTCLKAWADVGDSCDVLTDTVACTVAHSDGLCLCSR